MSIEMMVDDVLLELEKQGIIQAAGGFPGAVGYNTIIGSSMALSDDGGEDLTDVSTFGSYVQTNFWNPELLFDNNVNTSSETKVAGSAAAGAIWCGRDFGKVVRFKKAQISQYDQAAYCTTSVKLQISNDGSTWTDVGTYTIPTGTLAYQDLALATPIECRYARIMCNANVSGSYWKVAEMKFFAYTGKSKNGAAVQPIAPSNNQAWQKVLFGKTEPTNASAKMHICGTKTTNGTALSGGSNFIGLASSALAVDDAYNGQLIIITGGTGKGQVRKISDYDGAIKRAYVSVNWTTQPDATSTYEIYPLLVENYTNGAYLNVSAQAYQLLNLVYELTRVATTDSSPTVYAPTWQWLGAKFGQSRVQMVTIAVSNSTGTATISPVDTTKAFCFLQDPVVKDGVTLTVSPRITSPTTVSITTTNWLTATLTVTVVEMP